MAKRPKLQPAIPKEFLSPLGQVVANFAVLDSTLNSTVGLLLFGNTYEAGRTSAIITADLTFSSKVNLFNALYQHRYPEKKPFREMKSLLKGLKTAGEKRNTLIHSVWLAGGAIVSTSAKRKAGLDIKFTNVSVNTIIDAAEHIAEVGAQLQELSFHIAGLR